MAARLVRALASTAAFTGVALFPLAAVRERRQDPPATPSVLNMEVIPRTPERLARGSYLVNGLLWCQFCHSQEDLTQRPMRPVPGTEFGGQLPREEFGFPAGPALWPLIFRPTRNTALADGKIPISSALCGRALAMTVARCTH